MSANDNDLVEFEKQLADHGVRGALAWLNGRTLYRHTALYLVDGGVLKRVYVFDRNDPADKPYMSTPTNEWYCNLVMDAGQAIVITDSLHDVRTVNHPNPAIVRSYCGFPLRRMDGSVCGALCHFDAQPRELDMSERDMLGSASKLLSTALNQISKL